ncbi:cell wall hydrolase [Sphingomonas profundi]|uniref:cell wall hydrolase n=1 Tax=Alterirhizorhabdus profundi TaxID=2681549 RepID=UPI0012E933F4|nr:cell wall hydrolase [Sphingomonas profundi]
MPAHSRITRLAPGSWRSALAGAILLLCGLALLLAAIGTLRPTGRAERRPPPVSANAPAPAGPLPAVEPLIVREMTPDAARRINAAVPFVAGPVPPAPPFRFTGDPAERERALACLASALWYEAGNDPVGQQAVAQVVLNRLRHPAYPKSICGVVFQGAERRTGCQFTFTCDGALARRPAPPAWQAARGVAAKALDGFVYKPVGTATHYHTDWVVPYWSATLDKIAQVHTHLFFRWRGGWGRPAALVRAYQGPEPLDPRIAWAADPALAPPGAPAAPGALAAFAALPPERETLFIPGLPTAALKGAIVRLMDAERAEYGLQLDPAAFPGSYAIVALAICRDKPACTVTGWTRPDRIPHALPVPMPAMRAAAFLYRKTASGREDAYWNCRQFTRDNREQCLPGTEPETTAPTSTPATPPVG